MRPLVLSALLVSGQLFRTLAADYYQDTTVSQNWSAAAWRVNNSGNYQTLLNDGTASAGFNVAYPVGSVTSTLDASYSIRNFFLLGSGALRLRAANGAVLLVNGEIQNLTTENMLIEVPIALTGNGHWTSASGGSMTFEGPINAGAFNLTIEPFQNTMVQLDNNLSGSGTLTLRGGGLVKLYNGVSNTNAGLSGPVIIENVSLELGGGNGGVSPENYKILGTGPVTFVSGQIWKLGGNYVSNAFTVQKDITLGSSNAPGNTSLQFTGAWDFSSNHVVTLQNTGNASVAFWNNVAIAGNVAFNGPSKLLFGGQVSAPNATTFSIDGSPEITFTGGQNSSIPQLILPQGRYLQFNSTSLEVRDAATGLVMENPANVTTIDVQGGSALTAKRIVFGGAVDTFGASTITLKGNSTLAMPGGSLVLGGIQSSAGLVFGIMNVEAGSAITGSPTIYLGAFANSPLSRGTLNISGSLTSGNVELAGANGSTRSFGTLTVLSGGTWTANGNVHFNTSTSNQTVGSPDAVVDNAGSATITGRVLMDGGAAQLRSIGPLSAGSIASTGVNQAHRIDLADPAPNLPALTVGSDNSSTVFGGELRDAAPFGSGSFRKIGAGTFTLAGDNSFSGNAEVAGGTLSLANSNALKNATLLTTPTGNVSFTAGIGTLNLGGLAGNGVLSTSDLSSNAVVVSIGANGRNTAFGGSVAGAGSLRKVGTGTFTFSGTSSLTTDFDLQAGTLALNGSFATSKIRAANGTIVSGGGSAMRINALSGSFVAPGDQTLSQGGSLTVGSLDLAAGSTLSLRIGGTNEQTGFDWLQVASGVSLAANLQISLFNGFTPGEGDTFFILRQGLSTVVNGTFAGISQGQEFAAAGQAWKLYYSANFDDHSLAGGNDVALVAVPEPSVAGTVMMSIPLFLSVFRIRNKKPQTAEA